MLSCPQVNATHSGVKIFLLTKLYLLVRSRHDNTHNDHLLDIRDRKPTGYKGMNKAKRFVWHNGFYTILVVHHVYTEYVRS